MYNLKAIFHFLSNNFLTTNRFMTYPISPYILIAMSQCGACMDVCVCVCVDNTSAFSRNSSQ